MSFNAVAAIEALVEDYGWDAVLDTIIEMVASASDDDPTELKEMIEAALVVNAGKGQLYVM